MLEALIMNTNDSFCEVFREYDGEFKEIDRKEENLLVRRYQETGDLDILQKIYLNRVPTLKVWAIKYFYPGLSTSIDDFMGELTIVFMNAADKYNHEKGSFNTCLYTFLSNRIKNMKNATHAKKRRPKNHAGCVSDILISMDQKYFSGSEGNTATVHEFLSSRKSNDNDQFQKKIKFSDTIALLSSEDEILSDVFLRIGNGETMSSIIRDMKKKSGSIDISKKDIDLLKKNDFRNLKDIIIKNIDNNSSDFKIIDYNLINNSILEYSIEFKSTDEIRHVRKKIKEIKDNKDKVLSAIKEL